MVKPFLNRVSGKPIKSDVTTFTGGLNTCYDKTMIQDNQLSYVWNMSFKKTMSMATRSNRLSLAWFLEDTTSWGTGEILKMFATSEKSLITIEDNGTTVEVYELAKSGSYLTKTYIGTVASSSKYFMTECRDSSHKYIFIGTYQHLYKITKDVLTTTFAEVTTEGTPHGIVCGHKNRLFVANGTSLKFSTLREYTDFMTKIEIGATTGDTDNFTINQTTFISQLQTAELGVGTYRIKATNTNGTIILAGSWYNQSTGSWNTSPAVPTSAFSTTGILTGETKEIYIIVSNGSSAGEINITNAKGDIVAMIPFDGKLMIFCRRSWHILYGDSPNPEENIFQLVDLDDGIGTISDETVCICDRFLYFVDSDMSVYRYNGASITKVSEPYGGDNYASYGGISGIGYNSSHIMEFVLGAYGHYLYLSIRRDLRTGVGNDTLLVYDTKNRIWTAEDGTFSHIVMLDTDTATPFANKSDYLIGSMINKDIVIMNMNQNVGMDNLFNMNTRHFDDIPIKYGFETKTWNLGEIKKKKTLTNIWLQANAEGKVGVCDYWGSYNPWDEYQANLHDNFIILGTLKKVGVRHNVQHPSIGLHEGTERQRFIVPKMYMQKINAFSIRVEGTGYGEFFLIQKEWREA